MTCNPHLLRQFEIYERDRCLGTVASLHVKAAKTGVFRRFVQIVKFLRQIQ